MLHPVHHVTVLEVYKLIICKCLFHSDPNFIKLDKSFRIVWNFVTFHNNKNTFALTHYIHTLNQNILARFPQISSSATMPSIFLTK